VLEIESGDIVHYPNTWVNWANEAKFGMSFEERESIRKRYPAGPYSLIGPVAVKGAEPGDVIECRMIRLRPIDWGWNSTLAAWAPCPMHLTAPISTISGWMQTVVMRNSRPVCAFPRPPSRR
jgi:acetamidase/formamidase